eukprot:PhM_4_TR2566/c0_g1_i1/m.46197
MNSVDRSAKRGRKYAKAAEKEVIRKEETRADITRAAVLSPVNPLVATRPSVFIAATSSSTDSFLTTTTPTVVGQYHGARDVLSALADDAASPCVPRGGAVVLAYWGVDSVHSVVSPVLWGAYELLCLRVDELRPSSRGAKRRKVSSTRSDVIAVLLCAERTSPSHDNCVSLFVFGSPQNRDEWLLGPL